MHGPGFTIRKAAPADASAMFAVHQASVRELCADSYSPEHIESWFHGRSPDIYAPALAEGHVWVAEMEGRVVGFVGVEPGEVTLLFVDPQCGGQGIGRTLFEHGMCLAAGSADQPVYVVATKNSESFYAQYGFSPVEEMWFVRGAPSLQYPVVKMQKQEGAHVRGQNADA